MPQDWHSIIFAGRWLASSLIAVLLGALLLPPLWRALKPSGTGADKMAALLALFLISVATFQVRSLGRFVTPMTDAWTAMSVWTLVFAGAIGVVWLGDLRRWYARARCFDLHAKDCELVCALAERDPAAADEVRIAVSTKLRLLDREGDFA